MHRKHFSLMHLVLSGVILASPGSFASAGLFCGVKRDCNSEHSCECECKQKCCKPKRHCCLCPPDAPDAEIGFAQAAVTRPGPAVQIKQSALNRAAKQVLAKDLREQSAETDKSCDDRLADLEAKVKSIDSDITRIKNAVERLAEIAKPAAPAK